MNPPGQKVSNMLLEKSREIVPKRMKSLGLSRNDAQLWMYLGNAGDTRTAGLIPGSGRSPGGGNRNLLQYSCLGNPMDRGTWWSTVHGVAKSRTQLSDCTYTHIVDVQCCFSFRCTAKWFSYTYIYICFLSKILFHYNLSQDIEYSSLCYTFLLCIIVSYFD